MKRTMSGFLVIAFGLLLVAGCSGLPDQGLLEKGANANIRVAEGYTSLYWAVQRNHMTLVRLLVENGADINMTATADGGTALMVAVSNGNAEIAKYLIEKGADVNISNNAEITALKVARVNRLTSLVKMLEKAGARE